MKAECPDSSGCYLKKPFSDVHHLYYPRSEYKSPIEKEFRELPINKERLCRCIHNTIHATERPPKKPPVGIMRKIIEDYFRGR